MRRGDEFSINLGPNTLMNSRFSGSEKHWPIWCANASQPPELQDPDRDWAWLHLAGRSIRT